MRGSRSLDRTERTLWAATLILALVALASGPALVQLSPRLAILALLEREDPAEGGSAVFVSVGGGSYWTIDSWGRPYAVHEGGMYSYGPDGRDGGGRGDDVDLGAPEVLALAATADPWLPLLAWRVEY